MSSELLSVGEKALKLALKAGAKQCEAMATTANITQAIAPKGEVRDVTTLLEYGLELRSFVQGGGLGRLAITSLEEDEIRKAAEGSVKLAKAASPDPDFKSLPGRQLSYPKVEGYDKKVETLETPELIGMLERMIENAKVDARITYLPSSMAAAVLETAICNSEGISVYEKATHICGGTTAMIGRKNDAVGAYGSFWERSLRLVDLEKAGREVGNDAVSQLGAKRIKTGEYSAIFHPYAAMGRLFLGIAKCANGFDIQRQRSFLVRSRGKQIASDRLTLFDDATIPNMPLTSSFDGEGVARKHLTLIDCGVLKSFLHNSYSANVAGTETTGHAIRNENTFAGFGSYRYSGVMAIEASNLIVKPGDYSYEEMISETRNGVLIKGQGDLFTALNVATGQISGPLDVAYKIERGEVAYPIKLAVMGANIVDLLKGINAVGKKTERTTRRWDVRWGFLTPIRHAEGGETPYVQVCKVKIAS